MHVSNALNTTNKPLNSFIRFLCLLLVTCLLVTIPGLVPYQVLGQTFEFRARQAAQDQEVNVLGPAFDRKENTADSRQNTFSVIARSPLILSLSKDAASGRDNLNKDSFNEIASGLKAHRNDRIGHQSLTFLPAIKQPQAYTLKRIFEVIPGSRFILSGQAPTTQSFGGRWPAAGGTPAALELTESEISLLGLPPGTKARYATVDGHPGLWITIREQPAINGQRSATFFESFDGLLQIQYDKDAKGINYQITIVRKTKDSKDSSILLTSLNSETSGWIKQTGILDSKGHISISEIILSDGRILEVLNKRVSRVLSKDRIRLGYSIDLSDLSLDTLSSITQDILYVFTEELKKPLNTQEFQVSLSNWLLDALERTQESGSALSLFISKDGILNFPLSPLVFC